MKKIKVFVSQPMNGLTREEIQKVRPTALERVSKYLIEEKCLTDFTLVPINDIISGVSFEEECRLDELGLDPNNPPRTWWLGKDIQEMGAADMFVFCPRYYEAEECMIERQVCRYYFGDVPTVLLTDVDIICQGYLSTLIAKLKETDD